MTHSGHLALRYAVGSDAGISRPLNEDSAYTSPRLLAVADGMGGHAHGEVASSVTVGALAELDEHLRDADPAELDPLAALASAAAEALRRLTDLAEHDDNLAGMGSTLTALLWYDGQVGLAHIGDSRGYLVRDDTLRQLTRDHTLVQSLVDDGRITQEEAAVHPRRSMLIRTLQAGGPAETDLSLHTAAEGDRYLLCSDGLTCVVEPEAIHAAMTTIADPDAVVRHLIEEAKRLSSPDNITCVVADVVTSEPSGQTVLAGAAAGDRPVRRGTPGWLPRWAARLLPG
jgi:serine/threonine protein phosphatase PrpC